MRTVPVFLVKLPRACARCGATAMAMGDVRGDGVQQERRLQGCNRGHKRRGSARAGGRGLRHACSRRLNRGGTAGRHGGECSAVAAPAVARAAATARGGSRRSIVGGSPWHWLRLARAPPSPPAPRRDAVASGAGDAVVRVRPTTRVGQHHGCRDGVRLHLLGWGAVSGGGGRWGWGGEGEGG